MVSSEGDSIESILQRDGFVVLPAVLSENEVSVLVDAVNAATLSVDGVMRSSDRYAIRRVMQEVPLLNRRVWNARLTGIVRELLGPSAFVTKSIWFEKPPGGNWFVGWHQDISISVSHRAEVPGYSRWTAKHGMIGVVPPVSILERTLTVRIHLDDADSDNGAVRVLPGSHGRGIVPAHVDDNEANLLRTPGRCHDHATAPSSRQFTLAHPSAAPGPSYRIERWRTSWRLIVGRTNGTSVNISPYVAQWTPSRSTTTLNCQS
jgi:hypothetical protein